MSRIPMRFRPYLPWRRRVVDQLMREALRPQQDPREVFCNNNCWPPAHHPGCVHYLYLPPAR